MDPITAAITLVTAVVKIHQTVLEGMSVDQRIEYGRLILDDLKRWNNFLDIFRPH